MNYDYLVDPWDVDDVEDFMYYCCPECPLKFQEKKDFQEHALEIHPRAEKMFLNRLKSAVLQLSYWQNTEKIFAECWQITHRIFAENWENNGRILAECWFQYIGRMLEELQDIEHGNDEQSSQKERQMGRGLRHECKNLSVVEQKNLNELHLTLIEKYHMQTPKELFSKHIVYGKITEEKAIHLSNKRRKCFAEKIGENTVFEDPNQFHLCSNDRLHLLDAKSNHLYVSERRVRTFQCRYDPNLEDYTIEDLGMKIPILEMHDNGKYHFLKDSLPLLRNKRFLVNLIL